MKLTGFADSGSGCAGFDWRYAKGGRFATAQISARKTTRRELQSKITPPSIDQTNLPAENPLPESVPTPCVIDAKKHQPKLWLMLHQSFS
jgi:hypothetical protein